MQAPSFLDQTLSWAVARDVESDTILRLIALIDNLRILQRHIKRTNYGIADIQNIPDVVGGTLMPISSIALTRFSTPGFLSTITKLFAKQRQLERDREISACCCLGMFNGDSRIREFCFEQLSTSVELLNAGYERRQALSLSFLSNTLNGIKLEELSRKLNLLFEEESKVDKEKNNIGGLKKEYHACLVAENVDRIRTVLSRIRSPEALDVVFGSRELVCRLIDVVAQRANNAIARLREAICHEDIENSIFDLQFLCQNFDYVEVLLQMNPVAHNVAGLVTSRIRVVDCALRFAGTIAKFYSSIRQVAIIKWMNDIIASEAFPIGIQETKRIVKLLLQSIALKSDTPAKTQASNSHYYEKRAFYHTIAVALRCISRRTVQLFSDASDTDWERTWTIEGEIKYLTEFLNDDSRDIKKCGLGLLGNFIVVRHSYRFLLSSIPQFLSMAVTYLSNEDEDVSIRKEAILLLKNFITAFCSDNQIDLTRFMPEGLESADVSENPLRQLIDILESGTFFDSIDLALPTTASEPFFNLAASELLLLLSYLIPGTLFKYLKRKNAWPSLDMDMSPKASFGEEKEGYLHCKAHQKETLFVKIIEKSLVNVFYCYRLLSYRNMDVLLHVLEKTDVFDSAFKIALKASSATFADGSLQNQSLLFLSETLLVASQCKIKDTALYFTNVNLRIHKICIARPDGLNGRKSYEGDYEYTA
ncbi:hypothetical protein HDU97_010445 [Phlyctochytrium planicorne]|nr:hypothetical protein HDU97_010445 [Phlyctochytrium planicorne]